LKDELLSTVLPGEKNYFFLGVFPPSSCNELRFFMPLVLGYLVSPDLTESPSDIAAVDLSEGTLGLGGFFKLPAPILFPLFSSNLLLPVFELRVPEFLGRLLLVFSKSSSSFKIGRGDDGGLLSYYYYGAALDLIIDFFDFTS
jgi:hypothetical protein